MGLELASHPLFRGAPREEIAPILATLGVDSIGKGTLVSSPGTRRSLLTLVLDWVLISYDLAEDGNRVLYDLIEAGGIDGVLGVLGMTPHFTEASTPARIARLEPAVVDRLVESNPAIAVNLIHILTRRIARRERQLQAVASRDPTKRIAKLLLAMAGVVGRDDSAMTGLRIRITHQQIADMLGIRRETATIHLNALFALGALRLGRGSVTLSTSRLREIVRSRVRTVDRNMDEPQDHRDNLDQPP